MRTVLFSADEENNCQTAYCSAAINKLPTSASIVKRPAQNSRKRAGVNQQPPMHQLRMSPFNPFCG
jgi:hypothetical protein